MIIIRVGKPTLKEALMLIYTEPRYIPSTRATNYYDYYARDVLCNKCGKTIGTQVQYDKKEGFYWEIREKSNYKFCPYCGEPFKEEK